MAIADELKTLQELHEKGKLTEQEYADAKAATLKSQGPPKQRTRRSLTRQAMILLALLLVLLAFIWYNAGTKNTTRLIASAVHTPITLTDEVQNLPANSWKAVGLNLPYNGTLDINLAIVRGNPIDVFLTTPDQFDTVKKEDWGNVKVYGDFNAMKTTTYKRTARLPQGGYYLVMRDTSLGILSSSASDISVKVQLNP